MVSFLANRTPVIGGFTGPLLATVKEGGKKAKAEKLSGLLADPEALSDLLEQSLRPSRIGGLLDDALGLGDVGLLGYARRAAPIVYRGAPLLALPQSSDR